jgi:hypothetical protein
MDYITLLSFLFTPLSHLTDMWGPHVSGFFNLPPSLSSHALSRPSRPSRDQRLRLGARLVPPSSPSLPVPPHPLLTPRTAPSTPPIRWRRRIPGMANAARGARARPRWARPRLAELTADGARPRLGLPVAGRPAAGGGRPRLGSPMAGGARGRRSSWSAFRRRNPSPGTRARPLIRLQVGHRQPQAYIMAFFKQVRNCNGTGIVS